MTTTADREVSSRPSPELRHTVDYLCSRFLDAFGAVQTVRETTGDPSAIPSGDWFEKRGGRGNPGMPGVLECSIAVVDVLEMFQSTMPGPFHNRHVGKLVAFKHSSIELKRTRVVFHFDDGQKVELGSKEADENPPMNWKWAEAYYKVIRPRWADMPSKCREAIDRSPMSALFTDTEAFAEARYREFKSFLIDKAGLIAEAQELMRQGVAHSGDPGEYVVCIGETYTIPTQMELDLAKANLV